MSSLIVYGVIAIGLLLLMVGAVISLMGNQIPPTGATQDQLNQIANYKLWIGPAFWDIGMFFFLGGLLGAVLVMEHSDPFVRLFLIVVVFVALLLILSRALFLFNAP